MQYQELRQVVAKRARTLRGAKRWNQRQMEAASGVSQKAISNLEKTDASVQLDTLAAVADTFGMDVWQLLKPGVAERAADHGVDGRAAVLRDGPPGLQALAQDEAVCAALAIQPGEWRQLAAFGETLPPTVDKAGYVQLLYTIRTIMK